MRSTIIAGSLALAGIAAPASAQYYAAPEQQAYSAPRAAPIAYYRNLPALPSGYDRSDWMRDCHAYLDERRCHYRRVVISADNPRKWTLEAC